MDVSGQETDWRSAAFRQKLISQIEDAMRKAGVAHSKSSKDMESHVFLKAKTRDEYLSLVARLIIHFRDIHNKKSQASVSDPMNALQSLTGGPATGAAGISMPPRGPGQSLGGMGGLGAMGQPMPLSGQPPPGTSGMAPHGMAVVSSAAPQTQLQLQQVALQQQQQQQQQQFQQQQAALQQQQQQQQQQFQAQQNAMQQQFQAVVQQQQQQLQQQQQQQQHLIKLHHQNQQQIQQQQQQLQRMAQLQLQQQQQQTLQAQPPIQQPPMQQPQPPPSQALPQQLQQMHHPQHHQPPPQAQQPPVAQNQPSQLPPQSQSQPLVSQAQALPGQMLYAQQQLKFVRAPMVVQQPQVQPQVQQVQPQVQQQTAVQTAQAAQMVASGVQMITDALAQGGMHVRARFPPTTAVSAVPSSSIPLGGQPTAQVGQSSLPMLSSPSPSQQVQTPQSMPPPPQPSPQPGQPSSQPNSNVSSGPAPSPSSFLPSPSPQPSQSPVTARTPQNFSVPSPGPLNTPVNPSSVMSPASSSQAEEQQYLDKLKQLSKYIEPLRRMINKIDKNEDRKKDLSKMKSLLDILTDPSKRCPLKTLQKCEIALEKLKNDMAVPTPPPPPVPPTKQQYLCQPLLDAVLANIRSPVFNHSLYRTFVPAMTAIHGPPITYVQPGLGLAVDSRLWAMCGQCGHHGLLLRAPVLCTRKRKFEEDERQSIPNVLQGEVARLDPKFLVNLDPSHCSNNGTVHLICKLDDKDLPSVPPLELSVPADYPAQSPLWIDRQWQYGCHVPAVKDEE
ncbi:PREDICTED: mediator of RNA polymerase II transcription subunit 15 isoform X3 [Galeopterus variegatus]|uniref:Mediator of RNA polymerase II transcription subunit 15 n=1 Tax=Galeopterus variegatus TaxID=482537 RepID=A0ABM0R550_GALVR|nr:PREDICTED: mediator of RNA polymerase II transcription subunit 15 isoform X3 [Galeopterus variegatus]